MGIKSTRKITRDEAIGRILYVMTLLEEDEVYIEDEINQLLEEVMDTDLFRFSEFENYRVVKSLEDLS